MSRKEPRLPPEAVPTKPDVSAEDAPTQPQPKRRCGHLWMADDDRFKPGSVRAARTHFGAPRNIRTESMEMCAAVNLWDQYQTGTCVAQAAMNAIDVSLAIRGIVLDPASRAFAFAMALALGRRDKRQSLVDDGCYPHYLMQALSDYGVPTEKDWSFYRDDGTIDYDKVTQEPPLDVLEKAHSFHVSEWLRIETQGPALVDEIAYYIDQKHPVVYATEGDAFQSYEGGVIRPSKNPGPDGHDTLLLGQRLQNGKRQIRGLNSWMHPGGEKWGENGFYWAEEDFLTAPRAGDFYVVLLARGPGKLWKPKATTEEKPATP